MQNVFAQWKNSPFLDETTDVSVIKLICAVVQFFDKPKHILSCSNLPFQEEELPVDQYWGHVSHITDGDGRPKFDVVATFMISLLFLPHTNADTEKVSLL